MFTGLVQAVGQLQRCSGGVELLIPAGSGLDPAGLQLGDSVAVDGVCLTVTHRSAQGFKADVSEETLSRSTLAAKAVDLLARQYPVERQSEFGRAAAGRSGLQQHAGAGSGALLAVSAAV